LIGRKRLRRMVSALEARNPATVGIWGRGGVRHLIRGNYMYPAQIFPLPLTKYTFWVRRGHWRIFHISHFDLVD